VRTGIIPKETRKLMRTKEKSHEKASLTSGMCARGDYCRDNIYEEISFRWRTEVQVRG